MDEPLAGTGASGVSPMMIVDSSITPALGSAPAVSEPAGSGVWADNGEIMPKKQALINIAAKKNPKQGLDNFSFSPPKSKLTETIFIQ